MQACSHEARAKAQQEEQHGNHSSKTEELRRATADPFSAHTAVLDACYQKRREQDEARAKARQEEQHGNHSSKTEELRRATARRLAMLEFEAAVIRRSLTLCAR